MQISVSADGTCRKCRGPMTVGIANQYGLCGKCHRAYAFHLMAGVFADKGIAELRLPGSPIVRFVCAHTCVTGDQHTAAMHYGDACTHASSVSLHPLCSCVAACAIGATKQIAGSDAAAHVDAR